jgi:GNAT superfamily N-acetyltransferase
MDNYTMRTMTRDEVDLAVDWAAAEGWNPGLHDAASFHAADPDGFLVGLLGGEPIASISVVRYEGDFAFLGFYIVKPEHRGAGYGLRLWNEGMKRLDGWNIGLDGVVAQQSNYARWGFKWADRNVRYEGRAEAAAENPPPGLRIVDLSELPFDPVSAYDAALMPARRTAFLRSWLSRPGIISLGAVEAGRLAGYTVLRPCRAGYKFGPLFADSPAAAEALFQAASARVPASSPVYLDVPGSHAAAVALAERHGMSPVFETARMYRLATRPSIDLPVERWYGVTSFELG